MFHGKNSKPSVWALPLELAHASRYSINQRRGLIFQGEHMTAALLDRLTHHCEIFEMNSKSFRFRESMKEQKKSRRPI